MSRSYHQKHPVSRSAAKSSKKYRFPDPTRSHTKIKPYGRVPNSGYGGEVYLRSQQIEICAPVCNVGGERQKSKRDIEKELQETEYNIC